MRSLILRGIAFVRHRIGYFILVGDIPFNRQPSPLLWFFNRACPKPIQVARLLLPAQLPSTSETMTKRASGVIGL